MEGGLAPTLGSDASPSKGKGKGKDAGVGGKSSFGKGGAKGGHGGKASTSKGGKGGSIMQDGHQCNGGKEGSRSHSQSSNGGNVSGPTLSAKSTTSSRWRQGRQERITTHGQASPVTPPIQVDLSTPMEVQQETHGGPAHMSADQLVEQMDVVQALLNSLKGRDDQFSRATRTNLEKQLTSLRIQKTQTKSLGEQVSILQALVERRTCLKTEAEESHREAIADLEEANTALAEAQQQLELVRNAKAMEDAVAATQSSSSVPENPISAAKLLIGLLPQEKAVAFAECLALLESMAIPHQQKFPCNAQVVSVETVEEDAGSSALGVSPSSSQVGISAASAVTEVAIPKSPTVKVQTDPYGTPQRGRKGARSLSPTASPAGGQRSRSTQSQKRLRGKQKEPFSIVPLAGALQDFSSLEPLAFVLQ